MASVDHEWSIDDLALCESPSRDRLADGSMQGAVLALCFSACGRRDSSRQPDSCQDAGPAFSFTWTTAARIDDGFVSRIARKGSRDR